MKLRDRLADRAEDTIRHRRRNHVVFLLVGCPLIGGFAGLCGYGLALLISLAPSPYDLVGMIFVVVVMLALFGFGARRPEELVSDSVNRGMTRVYGLPWIPYQFRPRTHWDGEPWRSALIAAFMFLALDSISSTNVDLPLLMGSRLATGVVIGAVVALLKHCSSKETWRNLLEG